MFLMSEKFNKVAVPAIGLGLTALTFCFGLFVGYQETGEFAKETFRAAGYANALFGGVGVLLAMATQLDTKHPIFQMGLSYGVPSVLLGCANLVLTG
tara:strand:- start:228 stop:518 length:291 start_codon:yes stop_codon:yes gene_type:complete